jgi:hypothetical protein
MEREWKPSGPTRRLLPRGHGKTALVLVTLFLTIIGVAGTGRNLSILVSFLIPQCRLASFLNIFRRTSQEGAREGLEMEQVPTRCRRVTWGGSFVAHARSVAEDGR